MKTKNHLENRVNWNVKKILLVISLIIISVNGIAQTWNCGSPNEADVTATLNNGTLTISGTGAMKNSAPWYSVRTSINTLIISNGVTSIGNSAFNGCSELNSVTIPESITSIGYSAFKDCEYLEAIYFNAENCIYMGDYNNPVFYGCYPQAIIIGNKVSVIPEYAFCKLGGSFESIIIPESVTSIDGYAFDNNSLSSISIPNSVTSIGECAFRNCYYLSSVNIPDNINIISGYTFSGCSRLTDITIPSEVTSIASNAFKDCTGLESVTVQWTTPPFIWNDVFSGVNTSFVRLNVPEGTESAYFGAAEWKNFYIEGLSPYPGGTCGTNLTWTYDMNGTLTISGFGPMPDWYVQAYRATTPWIFFREKIHTVILPEGLTYIGDHAFRDFPVTSIIIPAGVSAIGEESLRISSLRSITCLRPNPPSISGLLTFSQVDKKNCNLYVLPESVDIYRTTDVWKEFKIMNYTSINNINAQADISIHINSASGFATITGLQGNETLQFYSANGQLLFVYKATSETENISVSHLRAGIYFVKINNGNTLKWIKR